MGEARSHSGSSLSDDEAAIAATRRWLEVAVIGLGLCPFAAAVHAQRRIRWRVSRASDALALRRDLLAELAVLAASDPATIETTLLIHPHALPEFSAYNRFLGQADRAVARAGLRGVVQIASFHPDYRFAGSRVDDVGNCSNRSPYPMLQLLRERSVEDALVAFADPQTIYRRNIARLRAMGSAGWAALWVDESGDGAGQTG